MAAEELIARAKSLRQQNNLAEAIVVAREATRLDPQNANAWWQLGLATMAQQGAKRALQVFQKTTELAPHYGPAWYHLGLAYAEGGKVDDAKQSLKVAFELDEELTWALEKLADIANETNDTKVELWALEHLEHKSQLSGSHSNRLGILYHREGQYAHAIRLYRRCALLTDDAAGWINLGLALSNPAVSQDADAVDALRQGQRMYPAHPRFKTLLDDLLPRLLKLSDEVGARQGMLADNEKYQHYISPIELMELGDEDLDELGAKQIQRAKRKLLQEIELENGKIPWMDGLIIDRSKALALCEEIASDNILRHHVRVYRDNRLRDFLSKGTHGDGRPGSNFYSFQQSGEDQRNDRPTEIDSVANSRSDAGVSRRHVCSPNR